MCYYVVQGNSLKVELDSLHGQATVLAALVSISPKLPLGYPAREAVLQHAYSIHKNWFKAFEHTESQVDDNVQMQDATARDSVWLPPPPGWMKLNFDAAFKKCNSYAYIAVIGRDSNGMPTGGYVKKLQAASAAEGEVLALEMSIQFVKQRDWRAIIVEGDAKEVIACCKDRSNANVVWERRATHCNVFTSLNYFDLL
ncbi:hypothetical protein IFM89_033433 [Coptis chinensis]|uniref:RNase H type-1 domain-containing protein n=1 Tax=Coptis chinensis TaxID=261450 RepID=A0A835M1F7_9MAGN|nr:hypothetical protein IFM89_033433 [Coptis chinensis]